MRTFLKIGLGGVFCLAAAIGAVYSLTLLDPQPDKKVANRQINQTPPNETPSALPQDPKPSGVYLESKALEDGGVAFAQQFTGAVRDPRSLQQLKDSILVRGSLGLSVMRAELDQVHLSAKSPSEKYVYAAKLKKSLGLLYMHVGRLDEAGKELAEAYSMVGPAKMDWRDRTELLSIHGIIALRKGEVENCVACLGPSSCIFPIDPAASHKRPAGSREAIEHFTAYLDELPGDLRVRWLLNLAYMTLGEYPHKVPAKYLVPMESFDSHVTLKSFTNVAMEAGLTSRGPNMAGGSVFDDFTGDGLPDLFSTSLDAKKGASFFVNRGDGTFADRSSEALLEDQVYALNIVRTDYDNDGDLDVLLLRGGWERPMRMSLLENRGDGTFLDRTIAAGLAVPISSEAACWGDYDNDGDLDVYVCGEYRPPGVDLSTFKPDPRNRGRLYRNNGKGTFENVAEAAGVTDDQYGKGCVWGDFDDDGKLDLFVSNMNGPSHLYQNQGDGTFREVGAQLGVTADLGFACWFFDYDNDGKLDLLVCGLQSPLAEEVALASSIVSSREYHPRLFRNLGADGFRDVTAEVGLENAGTPMGCNFGDFDNDGFLDFYLGTGGMSYSHLTPNRFYKNMQGKSFEDVTLTTRTGHLQKGHGVSFADYDSDGDLDLFCEAGGAVPGDSSHNILFRNPGFARSWVRLKLVGTRTNRAAIGAKIRATVTQPSGEVRTIHRTIGGNSSFGGNALAEHLGLGDDGVVTELEITWPSDGGKQVFKDLPVGKQLVITEGRKGFEAMQLPVNTPPSS